MPGPTVVASGCRLREETTSPSLCPGGGTDVPPVPSPRAYRRDSRLAPAPGPRSHQCHPSCRRSAPDAHLECPRSSQVSAALAPPPIRHVNCTCKAGELSHTIYRRLDVPVTSVLVLSMKYFDWHPSRGERGKMCRGKVRNEAIPHVGTE